MTARGLAVRVEMHHDDAEAMRALRDVSAALPSRPDVSAALDVLTRWAADRVRLIVIDEAPAPVDLHALGVVGRDA